MKRILHRCVTSSSPIWPPIFTWRYDSSLKAAQRGQYSERLMPSKSSYLLTRCTCLCLSVLYFSKISVVTLLKIRVSKFSSRCLPSVTLSFFLLWQVDSRRVLSIYLDFHRTPISSARPEKFSRSTHSLGWWVACIICPWPLALWAVFTLHAFLFFREALKSNDWIAESSFSKLHVSAESWPFLRVPRTVYAAGHRGMESTSQHRSWYFKQGHQGS